MATTKPTDPKITVEDITPTMARKYLDSNKDNRKVRPRRVDQYARQMANGQWLLTGDPIRFSHDGRLLDGQHRLEAIIAYGKSVKMVVMRDITEEAFKVIDSGLARSYADALGPDITSGSNKAAIVRVMFVMDVGGDPRKTDDMLIVSRSDVYDYYQDHMDEVDAGHRASSRLRSSIGPVNMTAFAALHVLAYRADPEMAESFVEGVVTGAMLSPGDPRLALRSWMTNQRGRQFPNAGWHLALFIKAWNAYMTGESRQVMSMRPDEGFPTLVTKRKFPSK